MTHEERFARLQLLELLIARNRRFELRGEAFAGEPIAIERRLARYLLVGFVSEQ